MKNELEEKLDREVSLYVRLSSADHAGFCSCFTCCVRKPYREMDAGHFISRSNRATRWYIPNIRVQCVDCNRFRDGMRDVFREELCDEIGDEGVAMIEEMARSVKQYSDEEMKVLIKNYKMLNERMGKTC